MVYIHDNVHIAANQYSGYGNLPNKTKLKPLTRQTLNPWGLTRGHHLNGERIRVYGGTPYF